MMQDFTVSYHILMPSTAYTFRYGISFPVYSKDSILTPSKLHLEYGYLQHKPFYRQTWFMVSLAHSESENGSVRSDPHSFVNHYANVNDSLRQSWKKTKPVRNYSSYSYSNGGQIIVNNMARSRAPLPGFPSFV
ncbi:hypothetical protein KR200_005397 [Drosophila serrata]|nr:hypothetical protein KR200_005397 [Drosophila serrata]